MLMHSAITAPFSLSLHVPLPHPFLYLSPGLTSFLSSDALSDSCAITPHTFLHLCIRFFFLPKRILMMAGLSQFSHHLRLICDTQLCRLKPLMAQRSTQRCQSWQPRNIPVCRVTQLVKGQGSGGMNSKDDQKCGKDGRAGSPLTHYLQHCNWYKSS